MKHVMPWMLFLLLLLPGAVSAQTRAAMVKSVSGKVSIHRQDQVLPAQVGMILGSGDLVVSAYEGYVGVMFTDGTVITLGPKTRFEITNYIFSPETATYDFLFHLNQGEAVYHSGKIGKLSPESVKLSTPKATVGIRGTRFIVKVD